MASVMLFSMTACRAAAPAPAPAPAPEAPVEAPAADADAPATDAAAPEAPAEDYKIGIITGTVSQGEEEFRAAENMKAKYGDMIVTSTYPDNFTTETETVISNTLALASDPAVKAIVFVQAVPGASAAIDKVRETRPEILFVAGVPGEDPDVIASKADVVLMADDLAMGSAVPEQAKKQGATTFVHYSFPRHLSYAMIAARRDLFKAKCAEIGIEFVEATAPDPTGDSGVAGAQQFILEDVPRKIEQYGKDTNFFSTNCSMQEPLIRKVLELGGIYSQQCCPSPYHAYPGALGIDVAGHEGDVPYMLDQIKTKIGEGGGTGRFSTWGVPINMLMVEAGVEYAKMFAEGKTNGRSDPAVVEQVVKQTAQNYSTDCKVTPYDNAGAKLENFFLLLGDFITF